MSHTPGPWEIWDEFYPEESSRPGLVVMVGGKKPKQRGHPYAACGGGNWMDNAHLIAAAPDLLEACRMALDDLISLTFGTDTELQSIEDLRGAIAKAEGEVTP